MKNKSFESILMTYVVSMIVMIISFSVVAMIFAIALESEAIYIISTLLTPTLAAMITIKLFVSNKQINDDDKMSLKLFSALIVMVFILPLFYGAEFYSTWLILFSIAFIPVYFYTNSQFSKIINVEEPYVSNDRYEPNEPSLDLQTIYVSKEKLASFTDTDIQDFFQSINLKYTDYFVATSMASIGEHALLGLVATAKTTNYLIAFNGQAVYMFELSRMSLKVIINCNTISWSHIEMKNHKKILFGIAYKIKLFMNNEKVLLQANKKFGKLTNQLESIENFISRANMN